MPEKCHIKLKRKGIVYYTLKITNLVNFNTENFDGLKRYVSNEVHRSKALFLTVH